MSNAAPIQRIITLLEGIIEESLGERPDLRPETPLLIEGLLDSLAVLQVFTSLQEEFGIGLEAEDITEASFATPRSIAALVAER